MEQKVSVTSDVKNITKVVHAVQSDTGRKLLIAVDRADLTTAFVYNLVAKKPSGLSEYIPASYNASTKYVEATMTNQLLAEVGNVRAQLEITDTAGRVTSYFFYIAVDEAMRDDSTIESSNEFTALQSMINGIAVVKAEFDAAMSAVSTDTELTNIRVKADGTTATTAGNAVREQITELKDDLSKSISNITEAENLIKENLISFTSFENGSLITDPNTGAIWHNPNYKLSNYIPVTEGVYSLYNVGDGGAYIAIYDDEKNITDVKTVTSAYYKLTVAEDGYVRITNKLLVNYAFVRGGVALTNPKPYADTSAIKNLNYEWFNGYLCTFSTSVSFWANANFKCSRYMRVHKGLYFVGGVVQQGGYIVEFDKDFNALRQITITSLHRNFVDIQTDGFITLSVGNTDTPVVMPIEEYSKDLKHKKVVFYGDSITALGNDFNSNSWQGIISKYFGMENAISVGIGGTGFIYNTSNTYDLSSHVLGTSLPQGATHYQGSGNSVSFCSWDRIVKTIPIDSEVVVVMGGTNDPYREGSNLMSANNTSDTAWINSSSYIGGDYDISKLTGAILSTIMKIRRRCPNAMIIMCSPIGGRGTSGQNDLNYVDNLQTFDVAKEIIEQSRSMSTDTIDMYSECGIACYNRKDYIYDSVHPNNNGMKKIARVFIEELSKKSFFNPLNI